MCQRRGQANLVRSAVWELSKEAQDNLRPIKDLDSTSLRTIQLGPEYGQLINDNWKFRDAFSLDWIRAQCESGMAYGVINIDQGNDVSQLISWIIAYKYVSLF